MLLNICLFFSINLSFIMGVSQPRTYKGKGKVIFPLPLRARQNFKNILEVAANWPSQSSIFQLLLTRLRIL